MPGGSRAAPYRDNQGYYLASSYLRGLLAVTGLRDSTLAVVDDAIVDDRLTYYLLHNQALALWGVWRWTGSRTRPSCWVWCATG